MSSIYRKGRDGYFYYQTYTVNPQNNKKDKRIFHSLGTKDRHLAKEKQIELDKKYYRVENSRKKDNKSLRILIILFGLVFLISIFILFYDSNKKTYYDNGNSLRNESMSSFENLDTVVKQSMLEMVGQRPDNRAQAEVKDSLIEHNSINISDYSIVSNVLVSGAFDQGQVSIFLKGTFTSYAIEKLCKEIQKDNSQYSNITICVYDAKAFTNDSTSNLKQNFTNEKLDKHWIALFTYNEVEGYFFDDNPSGYLGRY